ncbi:MAG: hypothetical protein PVF47_18580 [Anaerolineae bacterium]
MVDKIVSRIQFEMEQIDHLFDSYADLLNQVQHEVPDLVRTTALASVLHSFYNGLENIFVNIAKEIDNSVPHGPQWHRDLLLQVTERTADRPPVLAPKTAQLLGEYLAFRHFYRHSYSMFLAWDEMKSLVMALDVVWTRIKDELGKFLDFLSTEGKA